VLHWFSSVYLLNCTKNGLACRFRNLEYLEAELQQYYEEEQRQMEKQEKRLKKMQKRLA